MRTSLRRPLLGASMIILAGPLLVSCGSDDASADAAADSGVAASSSEEASRAAAWLAGQLEDGSMSGSYEATPGSGKWTTFTDHGLALDVLFALEGREDHAEDRRAVLEALEPEAGAYVGAGEDAYAGSHGKLIAALQLEGRDPTTYGEVDLLDRLEGLVRTKGDELGRAEDRWDPANDMGADYSNAVGQSWVVRALTDADSGLSDEAATFLLRQQCDAGFFRLTMESEDHTCDGGTPEESTASVDATGFAVLALQQVMQAEVDGVDGDLEQALADAGAWLTGQQNADGSFSDAGVANANSTGVAAQALLALGEEEAAVEAARWLAQLQVGPDSAGGLAEHVGAVAFDEQALGTAQEQGLTDGTRPQWNRATAQAVRGLDALGSSES